MDIVTSGFQIVNMLGLATIAVVAVVVGRRWRDVRPLTWFPLLWGLFGAAYYALVLAGWLPPAAVLMWGAMHRFMAVIMVLSGLMALYALLAARRDDADDAD